MEDSKGSGWLARILGASHTFWRWEAWPEGGGSSWPSHQAARAASEKGYVSIMKVCVWEGRIHSTSSEQPAAEAKKADGASWTALRILRPPVPVGRDAWAQTESSSWLTFVTQEGSEEVIIILLSQRKEAWSRTLGMEKE